MSTKSFFIKLDAIRQMYWRRLTMRLSRFWAKNAHLSKIDSANRIAELLEFGKNYRPDPGKKGNIDQTIHPRLVQHKIDTKNYGTKNMDCDDHAVYWCAMLLKNKLADKVWFVTIMWYGSGHAFCVYQKDGKYFWGDYRYPEECHGPLGYIENVNKRYSKSSYKYTVLYEVSYVPDSESIKIKSPYIILP